MTKDEAKQQIQKLIEKYKNLSEKKIKLFTEEDTKKDFILPLFEALGWDTNNSNGKSEVTAEEHQQTGRPDYGFYLSGHLKFFLEAKSLKADLNNEDFAKQAIRYSWNRGADWAILTDFEGLKVFYAGGPSKFLQDKKYFELNFEDYITDFEKLWELSKEAFGKNLIEKNATKAGKMPPKVSVGAKLYKDLNECREFLTDKLGQMNDTVDKDLLDEGVQKILNRLIFIRVAEDRGVEDETLLPLIRQWETSGRKGSLFQSLVGKFRELDEYYNSNLFSEHPLEKWDDYSDATRKVVEILKGKTGYFDYDFKAMPADVLGSVYENYLGYKLRESKKGLTVDKSAKKRKEQGIYYTPIFIVDYIVKNALKPVLDKCQTIGDLKKIKVLDPACGSGSFLIRAMDEISKKYEEFGAPTNEYTKLMILQENIFGVDLDEQAVEIARLNLLINALDRRMKLPDLSKNIKNGNSLISETDEELKKYFGKNFRDKKPFNWKEEFPEVFAQGGFDVAIGNPPYVFSREVEFENSFKKYTQEFYFKNLETSSIGHAKQAGKINLYSLFLIKGLDLLKNSGLISFIVPNNLLRTTTYDIIRKNILNKSKILQLVDCGDGVFQGVTASTIIIVLQKTENTEAKDNNKVSIGFIEKGEKIILMQDSLSQSNYRNNTSFTFTLNLNKGSNEIYEKVVLNTKTLGETAIIHAGGIATGKDKNEMISDKKIDSSYKPMLEGKDIKPYSPIFANRYILYDRKKLYRARDEQIFLTPEKLITQRIGGGNRVLVVSYDNECFYTFNSTNTILLKDEKYPLKYLVALLNSKLLNWYYVNKFTNKSTLTVNISKTFLEALPIKISFDEQKRIIISLVDKILSLQKQLAKSEENSNEWQNLKHEIDLTDKKIDNEVYQLYGITEEERKIIEGGLPE